MFSDQKWSDIVRIRTVKPEFWSHPVMAQQSDAVKLLALALLNYADDEGYFYAAPAMVRAATRPLDEDSTIVRASLEELEKIGYIETVQHPTHGPIGRVVSFLIHQRVDRANKSEIKKLYDSTIDRRLIDDDSPLEGNGMEQGREGRTNAPTEQEFVNFYKNHPRIEEDHLRKEWAFQETRNWMSGTTPVNWKKLGRAMSIRQENSPPQNGVNGKRLAFKNPQKGYYDDETRKFLGQTLPPTHFCKT